MIYDRNINIYRNERSIGDTENINGAINHLYDTTLRENILHWRAPGIPNLLDYLE